MQDINAKASRSALRRIPKQERSRERIDEILKVAIGLIGQKGIDAVTMKEIASLSGGPIASVYQYFPNKSAIVATLYERYISQVGELMQSSVVELVEPHDIFQAAEQLIDVYSQYIRKNPQTQDLINAIQADKLLADIDLTEMQKMADVIANATERFIPSQLHLQYRRTAFMMCHLTVSAVRLALKAPAGEGDRILSDFKAATRAQIRLFLDGTYNEGQ